MKRRYLGDSVYAESRDGHLVLVTSNGIEDTNIIFIDDSVIENLEKVIEEIKVEWMQGIYD